MCRGLEAGGWPAGGPGSWVQVLSPGSGSWVLGPGSGSWVWVLGPGSWVQVLGRVEDEQCRPGREEPHPPGLSWPPGVWQERECPWLLCHTGQVDRSSPKSLGPGGNPGGPGEIRSQTVSKLTASCVLLKPTSWKSTPVAPCHPRQAAAPGHRWGTGTILANTNPNPQM